MSDDGTVRCRIAGGPFDGADTEEFIGMQTIMMNTDVESESERGDHSKNTLVVRSVFKLDDPEGTA